MNEILVYVKTNWFQIIIDVIAGINIVVAGAKAMGWNKLAECCLRVENAIQAMVQAALNRGGNNVQKDTVSVPVNPKPSTNV